MYKFLASLIVLRRHAVAIDNLDNRHTLRKVRDSVKSNKMCETKGESLGKKAKTEIVCVNFPFIQDMKRFGRESRLKSTSNTTMNQHY